MGDNGREEREFEEYAAARWRHLVHAAILLGCSPPEAEDLAQTTLLKCFVAWSKVQRTDNRDAYVTTVLINAFRASRRRRWWRERPTEQLPETAVADEADAVAGMDAVERALGKLSAGQREVVVLRFWSHLSEQQIADTLRIAPGTVKSRLSRALALLATNPHITDLIGDSRERR